MRATLRYGGGCAAVVAVCVLCGAGVVRPVDAIGARDDGYIMGRALRVPGMPISLDVTRYGGLNDGPGAIRAVRFVRVSRAKTVASLAAEINGMRPMPKGPIACPADDGSHITLLFRNGNGSRHPLYVGLRGCQVVRGPRAAASWAYYDRGLIPRLEALLAGAGSKSVPPPYRVHHLRPAEVRRIAARRGRFLSTGQNGSHMLYLSRDNLYMAPSAGGPSRLIARRIADAAFGIDDLTIVARRIRAASSSDLIRINTRSGRVTPFLLPSRARLVGSIAGTGTPGLADALQGGLQYLYFSQGRRIEGIDPEHPSTDTIGTVPLLPPYVAGQLTAISSSGNQIAVWQPHRGLVIRSVGNNMSNGGGNLVRRINLPHVTFLSWAGASEHLVYRTGHVLKMLDVGVGTTRTLADVAGDRIWGAASDPWCKVVALTISAAHAPASQSRVMLVDAHGGGIRWLPLPFRGATHLEWSPWTGQTIGVTQSSGAGSEAWEIRLRSMPRDPAARLSG